MSTNTTSTPPHLSQHESPLYRLVGITLALTSAVFIGASFILKKKGLLDSNALHTATKRGDGHAYLKSMLWWTGMTMMLVGELCNVGAYAFQPAIIVTPLGAISVVISAVMSDIFLKEKLSKYGKIGCALCVFGATLLVVNSPDSAMAGSLEAFWKSALTWSFILYASLNAIVITFMIFFGAKRWGDQSPLVFITICSLLGSFVVVVLQVVGAAVVYSVTNPADTQFKYWSLYVLIAFVCACGVTQINYLNKALNLFSTAVVTPIYFVCFTTSTLICSAVLFKEFNFPSTIQLVSALVGFLVILGGVFLLFSDLNDPSLNANDPRSISPDAYMRNGSASSDPLLLQPIAKQDSKTGVFNTFEASKSQA
ncbi:hypothetical protein CcCBS67573_g05744 [Chytriomyces confervae]|uniref:Magnesium transporter n=1 Tax=Chytriomyces confervae TaxID=246404 RepID=A0A507F8J8_9FUNG|nr:hypothetical protein HDU80_000603 [Chytriomyces hyalinus]TPX72583.1 hypothetical protein CcCBS67573_g05744 [Chytriomyces confervae]